MKVIHLDLETTGLDWNTCHIVSVAMIADDTNNRKPLEELPTFHKLLQRHSYSGEPRALAMHRKMFEEIANSNHETRNVIFHGTLANEMAKWLELLKWGNTFNICGKNVAGFDFNFLASKAVPDNYFSRKGSSVILHNSYYNQLTFRGRVIDIGTLYTDFDSDESVPATQDCINRSKLNIEGSNHDALGDCIISVQLLRKHIDMMKSLRG